MDFNTQQTQDLHAQLREHLGPVVCAALEDETVTDIKCSDGRVWLTQHQMGEVLTEAFLSEDERLLALNLMANLLGKKINQDSPSLSGKLPLTGDRVQGFVSPTAQPSFYIRRHAPEIFSWADYLKKGIMKPWQVDVIREHIRKRSNIVWSGATGSGKTTALNTCIADLEESNEHLAIIEDTEEIRCNCPNVSRFLTNDAVNLQQMIMASMRVAPKRLIIGETRDKAGVDLLKAWSTGHQGGFTTIHSNSAVGVFERFAQFCQEAGLPPLWRLMQMTIGLIVHMQETPAGRRVTEIEEVNRHQITEGIPIKTTRLGPPLAETITH